MKVNDNALLEAAAHGRLPEWANVSRRRRAHMERVAALLDDWARTLSLPERDRIRWCAAGFLHDALRDAPAAELRPLVTGPLHHLANQLLHGPAVAERLRREGVDDEPLLRAIAYHTIGHPDLDELGRALFIADFIEPGRRYDPAHLAVLRARMPAARADVLRDVLRARMERMLAEGRMIRSETAAFWNAISNHGSPPAS
jgi:HD superfamily phosphohydrolase YqeK